MKTVAIQIVETPSKSKGWGAFKCDALGDKLLYSNKTVDLAEGASVTVEVLAMNKSGKGGRQLKGREVLTLTVTGNDTDMVELSVRPGSQECRIRIIGAKSS